MMLNFSTASFTRPRLRIPAVSMRTQASDPIRTGISTLSRVVPGRSWATTRSSPALRLIKVDLPTLGRPMIAMRGPPAGSAAGGAGTDAGKVSGERGLEPAESGAVGGRDADGIPEAEIVKVEQGGAALESVDLVGHHQHRLALPAYELRHLPVAGGQPLAGVEEQDHEIRLPERTPGLPRHQGVEAARSDVEPAGVDHDEGVRGVPDHAVVAVSRHPPPRRPPPRDACA